MNSNLNERSDYGKGALSTRGSAIEFTTVLDVIDVIKEKAPYYYEMIKDGKIPEYQQIFRGAGKISRSSSNFKQFKIYTPKSHKRHSAHTENYYTEIMDNSKYWSEYPKRSTSIVASTSKEKAAAYGILYHVIPIEENAKLGVAPESDIWGSFEFALEKLDKLFKEELAIPTAIPDFTHLAGLNNFLRTKFDLSKEADYQEMRKKIILNDKSFKLLDRDSTWNNSKFDYNKEEVLALQNKWGTFLNYIEYLLSPKWNGFEIKEYNSRVTLPYDREVWTDSDCLLIEESLHNRVLLALE
jgi:hypothetical protein